MFRKLGFRVGRDEGFELVGGEGCVVASEVDFVHFGGLQLYGGDVFRLRDLFHE